MPEQATGSGHHPQWLTHAGLQLLHEGAALLRGLERCGKEPLRSVWTVRGQPACAWHGRCSVAQHRKPDGATQLQGREGQSAGKKAGALPSPALYTKRPLTCEVVPQALGKRCRQLFRRPQQRPFLAGLVQGAARMRGRIRRTGLRSSWPRVLQCRSAGRLVPWEGLCTYQSAAPASRNPQSLPLAPSPQVACLVQAS